MAHLTDLIPGWHGGATDPQIYGITTDSRKVQAGWLFAALPGNKADGRNFIADACRANAAAILTDRSVTLPFGTATALVTDDNPRALLSRIAARFYPRQPATIAAITGTNGKTSTAFFAQHLWQALGHNAASLGTLGLRSAARNTEGSLTTPDPVTLHAELDRLAGEDVTHLAIEASSHGLRQHRLDGLAISAGAFTNLTRDHLDYHADMDDYLNAKARLFTDLIINGGTAVLNADVPEFDRLQTMATERALRVLSYGVKGKDIRLANRQPNAKGQTLTLEIFGAQYNVSLPLVGAFQAMNVLAALGLALADEQTALPKLLDALPNLPGVPGRLQSIAGHPAGAAIYVDYAHTPDALENAIAAIRPHIPGRLICLVGCGGDRDAGKRPDHGPRCRDAKRSCHHHR